MDERAEQIIDMQKREEAKAWNFRSLYQQVADLMYPLENQITTYLYPGTDKSVDVRDPTAIFALDDMVSGLIGTWIPSGRLFFSLKVKDRKTSEIDRVKRYLSYATQITHDEMFDSNYMLQLQQTVKSLVCFGTGNLYTEWSTKLGGLNYKDYHISLYTIKENSKGQVDTVILKFTMSARQAAQEYSNPGTKVQIAALDPKKESDKFEFIHIIRPREKRNIMFTDNTNMPFESIVVSVKDKEIIEESGFPEFPCSVARWEKSSCEKYGRGRGTVLLSAVKELQQMHKDFVECGNRWNRPTLEVVDDDIEGEVTLIPGDINHVAKRGSIGGLQNQLAGNFPITKEMLEFQQNIIKEGFYNDVFRQFGQLQGDRRVTLEIQARLREGLRRLVSPVVRSERELFTPHIIRSVLELIRNGVIPYPPTELQGQTFGIEYEGELAMALKDYQSRAFMNLTATVSELEGVFPGAKDIINIDRALPDIAITMGVKAEHLSTPEEINAAKQARMARQQQQDMLAAAQVAGRAYKDTSKKAEDESPAAQLQGALSGV
jgi:hypothetical protein